MIVRRFRSKPVPGATWEELQTQQAGVFKAFIVGATGYHAILITAPDETIQTIVDRLLSIAPIQPEVQTSELGTLLTFPPFRGSQHGKIAVLTTLQEESLIVAKTAYEKSEAKKEAAQEAAAAKAVVQDLSEQLRGFVTAKPDPESEPIPSPEPKLEGESTAGSSA